MKKIILTGDRPTGNLHIGHLFGSLNMRVSMQKDYDTYIMVADVQALTDNFNHPEKVRDNVFNVVIDNLSVGIDPNYSSIFIQSMIPEIAELTVFFSNLVTLSRLQRNPTVKTEIAQKSIFQKGVTYGFLGYPISQSADILIFGTDVVPVGEDQLPMIEQAREIARKFNNIYGKVFKEPDAKISDSARIGGLDGNAKMGKSLNNAIYLKDTDDEIEKKIMQGVTDTKKIKKNDPGNPDECIVFSYHKMFNSENISDIAHECKSGKRGCVDCKRCLTQKVIEYLKPIRTKRNYYENNISEVKKIISTGTDKASIKAKETMKLVKKNMKINYDL